ncbi:MAG TPA: 4-amino-4-deoxy-L-arabinose transferase [Casimicrobiaceae bacterium]|jgi:multidrug transporter EmrE-like cation transporter|nr:4-amino-4-deoxy-L-arabinose transferase [Casimicrobiaceae bacterium]HWD15480.1 4-amino-4-deoxy-L-arabinose transferase [Casimicrobiaceae bacterium]HWD36365.1 4-amino-4-deoxy-L-arabinose transferase [Casimicrobiaceae bacterium]
MSAAAFAFLISGVLLNAAAQLLLKAGTNRLGVVTLAPGDFTATLSRIAVEGHVLAGVALYGVSVVVWIAGLSRVPVSVAYPMLSLGYIVNALAAQYLFGEAVSVQRWLGIGFIVLGVWLVARST